MKRFFALILLWMVAPLYWLKKALIRKLLAWRAKLQIGSLRVAIGEADKDKEKTGRKNIVVFNSMSGKYEPIPKKTLKTAATIGKNNSNKAMTEGRRKMMKKKKRILDADRVKQIEEKSLYVTN